jgi:hypothetical protein
MNRQLYQTGGIMGVARENYGIGSSIKKRIRKIIPNEIADIAVKTAPFVAPFRPDIAAAMRGIGRFDQRGSVSDAAKQAAGIYALGTATGGGDSSFIDIPGSQFGKEVTSGFDNLTSFIPEDFNITDYIPDTIRNASENIAEKIRPIFSKDRATTKKIIENTNTLEGLSALMKATTYLLGTGLSYSDQQRINEAREEMTKN